MSKRSNQTNISVLINNQVVEDEMAPCYISTDKANGYEQFLISLLTLEITGAGVVRLWFALGLPWVFPGFGTSVTKLVAPNCSHSNWF